MTGQPLTPTEMYRARLTRHLRDHGGGTERRIPGQLPPRWTPPTPDEGPDAEAADLAALSDAYQALPTDARDEIAGIAADAKRHGYPISATQRPTTRRVHLGSALVTTARTCAEHDNAVSPLSERIAELMRAYVAHACDDEAALQPGIPIGAVVGGCNHHQAATVARLAQAFAVGDIALGVTTLGIFYIPTQGDLT